MSSLLHQVEQSGENISDEEAVKKVVPLKLQGDTGVYEKIVEVSCLSYWTHGHSNSCPANTVHCELHSLHVVVDSTQETTNTKPIHFHCAHRHTTGTRLTHCRTMKQKSVLSR